MEFFTHHPGPPLARFVDHCWYVRTSDRSHPRQTLFPDGGATLLFNLGDPHAWIRPTGREVYRRAWISGERREPYLLESRGSTEIVGVRFRPGGVLPFLGFPAVELTGEVVPLETLWGRRSEETRERMAAAPGPPEIFAVLQEFLLAQLRPDAASGNGLVERAIREIRHLGPSASIVQLAGHLGASHRHLLREFDRWVGLKPKMLQRILRFQRAVAMEERGEADWAFVAQDCGYYDQAHLIRDFRAFAGITPQRYRHLRLDYPNYVPDG